MTVALVMSLSFRPDGESCEANLNPVSCADEPGACVGEEDGIDMAATKVTIATMPRATTTPTLFVNNFAETSDTN
jgi:hypothetical protein